MNKIKNIIIGGLALFAALAVEAQPFQTRSFFASGIAGITVSNAAAAPLGGFTNINSWNNSTTAPFIGGTNAPVLTWTNSAGIWVIPTNGVPGTVSGIQFVQGPDSTALVVDLPLYTDRNGQMTVFNPTNNWAGDTTAYAVSPISLSAKFWGAASAGTALNLTFVGLPDGTNEVTSVAGGQAPQFVWGLTPISGYNVATTNFPIWKFAGCKTVRLKTMTLTTSTGANIGVTVTSLRLNGFIP